ncbi:shikimate dehydrogenase [Chloroflexi bacterium TSY]|nr:shikimate dehydrogenase [Chloroflexi bacterium TSY]
MVGLIGYPVSHSISPPMHNAAFSDLGLDWCYIPLPVPIEPRERIAEAVRGVRALGLAGCNVTVPHKQAVMPHLDKLTQAAEAIGAVNTIRVEDDGSLLGDNTDAPGFVRDIESHGVELRGKWTLVLGAGGSSRAIVYGLANAGCVEIAIANRTVSKAHQLATEMQVYFDGCSISGHAMSGDLAALAQKTDLIVNCTSLGMTPNVDAMAWDPTVHFRSDQIVYDLVYNPPQTRILQKAEQDGAQAIGGLGMLVWQGAIAFEIWTGQFPSVVLMTEAVTRAFSDKPTAGEES